MRPLTDLRPKPALLVAGTPLVGHQLRWFAAAGIESVRIATGYRAETLEAVIGDGCDYGVAVTYVQESSPLGTAGALAAATRGLDPDTAVVVANGDQLTRHSLRAQLHAFHASSSAASIHARWVEDARPFGLLQLQDDRVIAFREKPAERVPGTVNAGTYVLRAGALASVPPDTAVSLERQLFPALIDDGALVTAYVEDAYCLDVGSPRALLQANLDEVARTGMPARVDGEPGPEVIADGHSWVGSGATVGARSRVHASVLMPGCIVGDDCDVVDSIVAQHAIVASGVRLRGNVIGEGAVVGSSPAASTVVGTGATFG